MMSFLLYLYLEEVFARIRSQLLVCRSIPRQMSLPVRRADSMAFGRMCPTLATASCMGTSSVGITQLPTSRASLSSRVRANHPLDITPRKTLALIVFPTVFPHGICVDPYMCMHCLNHTDLHCLCMSMLLTLPVDCRFCFNY